MGVEELDLSLKSFVDKLSTKGFFLEYELFRFLYESGARYHEAVNDGNWELSDNDILSFDTLKKGGRRSISVKDGFELIKYAAIENDNIHVIGGYRHHLDLFRKTYLNADLKIGKKHVGLHLFRHNKMKIMFKNGSSYAEIAEYFKLVSVSVAQLYVSSVIE